MFGWISAFDYASGVLLLSEPGCIADRGGYAEHGEVSDGTKHAAERSG